jgi:hypothetical protein
MPYGPLQDMAYAADPTLDNMLGVDSSGVPPENGPPEQFQTSGIQSLLEALYSGMGNVQLPPARGFGQGFAQGLAGSLSGQGAKVAAARAKFEASQTARRAATDKERLQVGREVRRERGTALRELSARQATERREREKYERESPVYDERLQKEFPWAGRFVQPGGRIPANLYAEMAKTTVPETAGQKASRARAESSAGRMEAAAQRAADAAERQTRLAELNSYDKVLANYQAEPAIKAYTGVRSNLMTAESAAKENTGAGDIAMIYSWHRALEPDKPNVVREGDVALTRSAISTLQRTYAIPGKFFRGTQLTPEGREYFLHQMRSSLKAREPDYKAANDQYRGVARRFRVPEESFMRDLSAKPASSTYWEP